MGSNDSRQTDRHTNIHIVNTTKIKSNKINKKNIKKIIKNAMRATWFFKFKVWYR